MCAFREPVRDLRTLRTSACIKVNASHARPSARVTGVHASEYIETTVAQHAPSALKPPVARQSPASTAKQVASTTPFRRAPAASVLMHPRSYLWVPAQTTRPSGKRAAVQAVKGMPGLDEKGAKVAECTPPSPSPFLCTADVRPSSCSLGPTITFLR